MKHRLITLLIVLLAFSVQSQTTRKVIAEHFTNTRCSICSIKNPSLFALLDNHPEVIHLSIHPSSPYSNCLFSQHNPSENDARTQYYGIYGSTPRVVLAGTVIPSQSPMLTEEQLMEQQDAMSDYSIQVHQFYGANETIDVKVKIERLSGVPSNDDMVYVVLAEKEVDYNAPNGEDLHHNVFRKELGNMDLPMLEIGEEVEFTYNYTAHSDWVLDEIFALAIIQNSSNKKVLQADESDLVSGITGIDFTQAKEVSNMVYPNPFTQEINIQSGQTYQNIIIYNLFGQKVLESQNTSTINASELGKGIYLLELIDENGQSFSTKIQKQ
ncbi:MULTISPECIES: T9SS type A sorting domain-containing protein [unclassified Lentimicrobium]|uniref:T9SS type A sorting domain-containing protein n=1 Tax=unclassified Lentimicrobium TaxID=2677434 RepID=UPI0015556150|nr:MULTISPECIES: T9SS type A sorting domain-containing protein [unclassified Lentimicrobium]NPD48196.1 T9SS type A sorting domain-containing protein [Lentimicrobium sp. S6]NPD86424.1 T9SS type A sorting domain-containing protein [Lentimicrobium sp. L6]